MRPGVILFAAAALAAASGCAVGGRVLGGSKDFSHDRSYAVPAGRTFEALKKALGDLSFPIKSEDDGVKSLRAGVNWAVVSARGRFEIGLKDPTTTEITCRVEPRGKDDSILFLTLHEPGGVSLSLQEQVLEHQGDAAQTVFNKTQDRLAGGLTAEKGQGKDQDK